MASRDPIPLALVAAAGWAWRILVLALAVTLLGMLALRLELIVLPLLISLLLTALLHRVNSLFRRAGLPRGPAAAATVLLALTVLGGIGVFVVNRASAQYPELLAQVDVLSMKVQNYLSGPPLRLRSQVGSVGGQLTTYLGERKGMVLSGALTVGKTVADVFATLVLVFFLTIFMLYDGERIWAWIAGLFPSAHRRRVDEAGVQIWHTLTGYVTGTFTVALFQGVLMGTTLAVVGVPLVAPLAVLIFIGAFIPLIGAVVFGGLAVLVTLVAKGTTAGIVVLAVLLIANQIEGHVLQPFVVGRHVRLHPMAIAVTLASGAVLAGVPGAIFSVPLVAAVNAAGKSLSGRDVLPVVTDDATGEPPEQATSEAAGREAAGEAAPPREPGAEVPTAV